jgi:hypothetical protein
MGFQCRCRSSLIGRKTATDLRREGVNPRACLGTDSEDSCRDEPACWNIRLFSLEMIFNALIAVKTQANTTQQEANTM